MTPDDIQTLFQSGGPVEPPAGGDGGDGAEEVTAGRVAALKEVLAAAQQLWSRDSGSEELDLFAEKLGDGSRDVTWRVPIGESGLLDFFLDMVSSRGLRQSLSVHALRLIGNSCADTDENRARVVAGSCLPAIVGLLADDALLAFVIPVLYNICVDYEPAQLQACNARLSAALVSLVSSPRLLVCQAFLNIIAKILGLLATQEPEALLADPATPAVLLGLATSRTAPVDDEDFCALVSVALAYLTREKFQEELVATPGAVPTLLTAFADSYTRLDASRLDPDDAAQVGHMRTAFVQILADVSALAAFPRLYPLDSPVAQTLQSWLHSSSSSSNGSSQTATDLVAAACMALGNLARSDEASIYLVREAQIHMPLIDLLASNGPSAAAGQQQQQQLSALQLHAVLSFLKNLAIPAANKPALGGLLDVPASILPRVWSAATDAQTQTQFAAVSLARLLVVSCAPNVRRLCAPLSPDPSSPAHDRSNLHVLMALLDRTNAEPTKLEAARAVAAVCRVLHSAGEREGDDSGDTVFAASWRARFYQAHLDITNALMLLVTQTRFPALRSEAWFVLALMSRADDGARLVLRALQPYETCRALVEAVSGRDMIDGHHLYAPKDAVSSPDDGDEFAAAIQRRLQQQQQQQEGTAEVPVGSIDEPRPQQSDDGPRRRGLGGNSGMARIDRENGLVLISQLLSNYSDYIQPFRRSTFEQLLQTGGELVLFERARDPAAKPDQVEDGAETGRQDEQEHASPTGAASPAGTTQELGPESLPRPVDIPSTDNKGP